VTLRMLSTPRRRILWGRKRKLALNSEIIRNRMKIEAAVRKARAFLKIQEEFGSLLLLAFR
jgi:3-methyladenine DNA glycosylase Tag